MRAFPLLVLLFVPLVVSAADVRIGDTAAQVRTALGTPRGQVKQGDHAVFYYDRGQVALSSDTVTQVSMMSETEYAANESRRAAMAEKILAETTQLNAAGEAIMTRQLANTAFKSAPAAYQVSFWQNFARRYPGVNCVEPLTLAQINLATELDEKRSRAAQDERLADLEARVAAAETNRSEYASAYEFSPVYAYDGYRRYHSSADAYRPLQYQLTSGGYIARVPTQPAVYRQRNDSTRYDRTSGRIDCAPARVSFPGAFTGAPVVDLGLANIPARAGGRWESSLRFR